MGAKCVVIEGPDYVGKTTLAQELSKAVPHSVYLKTPPKRYAPLRPIFDNLDETHPMSRFLFYSAGIYESSNEIKDFLSHDINVFVDRYIQSLQFYHEALLKKDLTSFIGDMGLVSPDMVFVLQADQFTLLQRAAKRHVKESDYMIEQDQRVMKEVCAKYRNLRNQPGIETIETTDKNIDEVVRECLNKIQ